MLKLKLQYFGHLMRRVESLEKTLMLGGIGGRRRRGRQRMRWLDGITDLMDWVWVNSGSWWWTGRPDVLLFMGSQRVGQDWATELNWTELKRKKNKNKNIFNCNLHALSLEKAREGLVISSHDYSWRPFFGWTQPVRTERGRCVCFFLMPKSQQKITRHTKKQLYIFLKQIKDIKEMEINYLTKNSKYLS